jgi:hypothetical protein
VGGQRHTPTALLPGNRPCFYCIGGWVGPRAGLDWCEKSRLHRDSFFNLSARWGGWSTPHPDRFTPGKQTLFLLYRRLGGPQGRSGLVRKISPSPGFDLRTVQPVASRYTDWAIPAHYIHRLCGFQKLYTPYKCYVTLEIKVIWYSVCGFIIFVFFLMLKLIRSC